MTCDYIRHTYNVPAEIHRRVTVNGRHGTIAKDLGHYLGVQFDSDPAGRITPCHPTWRVEYHKHHDTTQAERA